MSTSNIVPYYSSSPPPLDEDDDTAHSMDADDDEFGDFSCAPAAKTSVDKTTVKPPGNESVLFRPISNKLQPDLLKENQCADDYEVDEPPPIFGAKSEPVSLFSPVFMSDQFVSDHQKHNSLRDGDVGLHSLSAGEEQEVRNGNADSESKISSESNCLREANDLYEQKIEETSDASDSVNFASFDGEFVSCCEDCVKNEEEEDPIVHGVHTDQCTFTDVAPNNSCDTVVLDAVKDPVEKDVGPNPVLGTNTDDVTSAVSGNVAKDEFDDFESFNGESALKDDQSGSVALETNSNGTNVSVKEGQENEPVIAPDEECNIKTMEDFEEFQAADEFDDFESFPLPVKPDSLVAKTTPDEAEISVTEDLDDFAADAPNTECEINAVNDAKVAESANEFDDFESCRDEFVSEDDLADSVLSKVDSDNAEILVQPGDQRVAADASMDDMDEFEDEQESAEGISFEKESGNEVETPSIEAVQSNKSSEKISSLAKDELNDFDEFDDFQFASAEVVNPPATIGQGVAVSVATTFKTDDSGSSWSAFGKDSPLGEANEDSWAAFKSPRSHVVSNASHDVVQTEQPGTTVAAEEDLKTPATAWQGSSAKATAEGSEVNFDALTSRVVANCYPLVKENDTMQPQFLLDVISQLQELTDESAKSLSFHTRNMDAATAGENKSCLPDVCVWNNLKMMDLTSAFSFQWPTSSISRNLLGSINVDLSSILVGHKKPYAPLFAPNLGLLEPMKAPTELQISQADKDPLTFATSDSSSTSSVAMCSAFSPQDGPQLEFDWGGSGLTNPLDATEKERELLDALEPPASERSMRTPTMSLETMLATLLPSIPSTQLMPKPQKDVDRKHLSEEAIQVLSKLPDLSFMQAKVLMFPLKDVASN